MTESKPTPDQLRNILEYVGENNTATVVQGAKNQDDAQRIVRMDGDALKRPLVSTPLRSTDIEVAR